MMAPYQSPHGQAKYETSQYFEFFLYQVQYIYIKRITSTCNEQQQQLYKQQQQE